MKDSIISKSALDEYKAIFRKERNKLFNNLMSTVKGTSGSQNANVNDIDPNGDTILISTAAEGYSLLVMQLLWIKETKVNAQNRSSGKTALIHAAANSNTTMVNYLLLRPDININIIDKNGNTALMYAIAKSCAAVVKDLLESSDDIKITDAYQQTVLMHAAARSNTIGPLLEAPYIAKCMLISGDLTIMAERPHKHRARSASVNNLIQPSLENSYLSENISTSFDGAIEASPENSNEDIMTMLLEKPCISESINARDEFGNTALMHAAINGNVKAVQLLLEKKNIEVNLQNSSGFTALTYAASSGNWRIVGLLLTKKDIKIDLQIKPSDTLLKGNKDNKAAASPNCKNKLGNTALIFAAANGHKEVISLLLNKIGIDSINIQGNLGNTALIFAAANGHYDIVKDILKKSKTSLNIKDLHGRSALACAAIHGHYDIVSLLINTDKININTRDDYNKTPLLHALYNNNRDIAKQLLSQPNTKIFTKDHNGNTAFDLFELSNIEDAEMLALFLQKGAYTNKDIPIDIINKTIIILAAKKELTVIQNVALNWNHQLDNALTYTAKTDIDAAKIILTADLAAGMRVLMSAVESGNDLIVKNLLTILKINPRAPGTGGKTVLINAISKIGNKPKFTESFIPADREKAPVANDSLSKTNILSQRAEESSNENYAEIASLTETELTSKGTSIASKETDTISELGSLASEKTAATSKETESTSDQSHTPNDYSGPSSYSNIVELFLNYDGIAESINSRDDEGKTALIHAAINNNLAATEQLSAKAGISINIKDKSGLTALMYAAANGNTAILMRLLEVEGIKANLQGKHNNTALTNKTFNHIKNPNIINEQSASSPESKKDSGNTALILAAANGHEDAVSYLLGGKNDVHINTQGVLDKIALMHAAYSGHIHIARRLLSSPKIDINLKDLSGASALTYALIYEHYDIALLFISTEGVDLNITDNKSYTELMYSASNNKAIMKKLLENPAIDIHAKDSNGNTLFKSFKSKNIEDPELLALFLQRHADVGKTIPADIMNEAITILSIKKDTEAIRHAYTLGYPLDKALSAVIYSNIDATKAILSVNPLAADNIFIRAVTTRNIFIIERLLNLQYNNNVNTTDDTGNTALMHIVAKGDDSTAKLLLEAPDIEINIKSKYGNTELINTSVDESKTITSNAIKAPIAIRPSIPSNIENISEIAASSMPFYSTTFSRYTPAPKNSTTINDDGYNAIVAAPISSDNRSELGNTALIYAVSNGHENISLQLLAMPGIDPNIRGYLGYTALIIAVFKGYKDVVSKLLTVPGINVNITDCYGRTALTHAAINNQKDIALQLLNFEEIDINVADNSGKTPLMYAAANACISITRRIISMPAIDIHAQDFYGQTAFDLFEFEKHDNENAIVLSYFLQKRSHAKENIPLEVMEASLVVLGNLKDQESLQYAVSLGYNLAHGFMCAIELDQIEAATEIIKQDKDKGHKIFIDTIKDGVCHFISRLPQLPSININFKDKENHGFTALMYAVYNNDIKIAKKLIDLPDIDVNIQNDTGKTALIFAVMNQNDQTVDLLLESPAINVNLIDSDGKTALMYASRNRHGYIAYKLLKFPQIDLNIKDKNNRTLLDLFIINMGVQNPGVLEILLKKRAHTTKNIPEKIMVRTLANLAAKEDQESINHALLLVNDKDRHLHLALSLVAKENNLNAAIIISRISEIATATTLLTAALEPNTPVIKLLIKIPEIYVHCRIINKESLFDLLIINMVIKDISVLEFCLQREMKTKKNIPQDIMIQALTSLAIKQDKTAIQYALTLGYKLDSALTHALEQNDMTAAAAIFKQDKEAGSRVLADAVENCNITMAQQLIQLQGININAKGKSEKTAFDLFITKMIIKDITVLELFLQKRAYTTEKIPQEIMTQALISFAIKQNKAAIEQALLLGYSFDDAFTYVLRENNITAATAILKQNQKVATKHLIAAAQNCNLTSLQHLTSIPGINVNVQDEHGYTALIYATENNSHSLVKILTQMESIIVNMQNNNGKNALMIAASKGYASIAKELVQAPKAYAEIRDPKGNTALMLAADNNHLDVAKEILKIPETSIKVKNKSGHSAFDLANDDIKALILAFNIKQPDSVNYKASVKVVTSALSYFDGESGLSYFGNTRDYDTIRKALKMGYISFSDSWINRCAEKGNIATIQILLVDHPTDTTGERLLAEATASNNIKIVKSLLDSNVKGINSQKYSYWRRTPLITAARDGYTEIVKALVEHGADLNIVASFGWGHTALSFAVTNDRVNIVKYMCFHIIEEYENKARKIISDTVDNIGSLVSNNNSYQLLVSIKAMLRAKLSLKSDEAISWAKKNNYALLALALRNAPLNKATLEAERATIAAERREARKAAIEARKAARKVREVRDVRKYYPRPSLNYKASQSSDLDITGYLMHKNHHDELYSEPQGIDDNDNFFLDDRPSSTDGVEIAKYQRNNLYSLPPIPRAYPHHKKHHASFYSDTQGSDDSLPLTPSSAADVEIATKKTS